MDKRFTYLLGIIIGCSAQIFQYFIVNNKENTAKVIDTIKLPTCTHLDQKDNVTLRGGIKAGKFTKHGVVKNMNTCIDQCCQDETCNVAFMPGTTCYTVSCYSEPLCESIPAIPSNLVVGGVQISHVIRNGGKGDDVDEFRKHSGVNRNSLPGGDKCMLSSVLHNQTIIGGVEVQKNAGEVIDLGKLIDVHDCAEKCCQHENCEVAVVKDNKCLAIDCFTMDLCASRKADPIKGNMHMLVYINRRNTKRQRNKSSCKNPCFNGICTSEDTCTCDKGFRGEQCDKEPSVGICEPLCGPYGRCTLNDTCLCDEGWSGYKCDKKIVCNPPCENGFCVKSKNKTCKCEIGWSGLSCNESNGDRLVLASSGEEVLFTEAEVEPELDIKVPETPPLHGSESVSTLAIAICCGIAAAILGAAAVMFIAKQILGKRAVSNYDVLNEIPNKSNRSKVKMLKQPNSK